MSLRFLPIVLASAFVVAGCGGKEVVRGADDPSVDAHALSTGLDKEDISAPSATRSTSSESRR